MPWMVLPLASWNEVKVPHSCTTRGGRGVHCGNGKAGGQESHNRSNVWPGHGDLAGR